MGGEWASRGGTLPAVKVKALRRTLTRDLEPDNAVRITATLCDPNLGNRRMVNGATGFF